MTIYKQLYELSHVPPLKSQTRRCAKPGEMVQFGDGDSYPVEELVNDPGYFAFTYYEFDRWPYAVYTANGHVKAVVGRDYAIVPKRGLAQVGRYKLLSIRVERVQDITEEDAIAEGFWLDSWDSFYPDYTTSVLPGRLFQTARDGYEALWKAINTTRPYRWQDNPVVFVYGIQVLTCQVESEAA